MSSLQHLHLDQLYCCKFYRYCTDTTLTTAIVVSVAAVETLIFCDRFDIVAAVAFHDTDIFRTTNTVVSVADGTTSVLL